MPMSSQFALSLELSRVVPLAVSTVIKTAEAMISLARDLHNSGSDIVIEDDIRHLFGRCRISPLMERGFRALVANKSSIQLPDGMSLESGPGPTVARGLQDSTYFAVVLQCSLLTSVHERNSLAQAISRIFEKEAEDASPQSRARAAPSQHGILGMLQACEDQTSSYDWKGQFLAIVRMLDVGDLLENHDILHECYDMISSEEYYPMPAVILRGAVYMLPMVQSLPEDRYILVQTHDGIVTLLVWAHLILGLTVLVKFQTMREPGIERKFGDGQDQLCIVVDPSILQPSITLMESKSKENYITLQPDPGEDKIEGLIRHPVRSFGTRMLYAGFQHDSADIIVEELKNMATAFALIIAENAVQAGDGTIPAQESSIENPHNQYGRWKWSVARDAKCHISKQKILEAAKLLFDDERLQKAAIEDCTILYRRQPLVNVQPPKSVQLAFKTVGIDETTGAAVIWEDLLSATRTLAILILALSQVQDLAFCANLPLCFRDLSDHPIISQLHKWDGKSPLRLAEDAWLEAIGSLMACDERSQEEVTYSLSMLSDRGWTICLATIGVMDPSHLEPGAVHIARGVPTRNGIRKHLVLDAPKPRPTFKAITTLPSPVTAMSPRQQIRQAQTLFGERGDAFVTSVRLILQKSVGPDYDDVLRTGYRELAYARWTATSTVSCAHVPKLSSQLLLAPQCVAVDGFWQWAMIKQHVRIVVALTANSTAARWRALIAAAHAWRYLEGNDLDLDCVLLRNSACCVQCAVDQALLKVGRCLLVL